MRALEAADLSPEVRRRLGLQPKKRAPRIASAKRMTVDGVTFPSEAEAKRWVRLRQLEAAGEIRALQRQVAFVLAPGVRFSGITRARPALRYFADFTYEEQRRGVWVQVVEDCKGHHTETFKIKRHLMMAIHGIDLRLTK